MVYIINVKKSTQKNTVSPLFFPRYVVYCH